MDWMEFFLAVIVAVLGSTGLWSLIQKKMEKKDLRTQMLLGLAHDRIMYLGFRYLERGYITKDEYENYHDYLYVPYEKMGGNGIGTRLMKEIDRLELRPDSHEEMLKEKGAR